MAKFIETNEQLAQAIEDLNIVFQRTSMGEKSKARTCIVDLFFEICVRHELEPVRSGLVVLIVRVLTIYVYIYLSR